MCTIVCLPIPIPGVAPQPVLEDLYTTQGLTMKQVGEKVDRSAWTVHQALRAYRIPIRPRGHGPSPRRLPVGKLPDDEELARIYDAGHGFAALARRYGVSMATVRDRVISGGGHVRPKGRPLRLQGQRAADAAPPTPGPPR